MNDNSNKPKGREIQTAFFKAYEFGGVFHSCIDWMRERYDLGYKSSPEDEQMPKEELSDRWRRYYDVEMPQIIADNMEAFDSSVIDGFESTLINEIATVLDELTGKPRERYIYSLLKPFKELSDIFHPEAELKRLRGEVENVDGIEDCQRELAYWEACNPDEQLHNVNGEPSSTPKEQAEACKKMIARYEYQIKRVNELENRYLEILNNADPHSKLSVETNLCILFDKACRFANRLDALLLERGINLLWYQQESGIYLKSHREITDVSYYIGSDELTAKYIAEAGPNLIKDQQTNDTTEKHPRQLPSELDTPEANKYFARAVAADMMQRTDSGGKWKTAQARLGYFCNRVFPPPRPIAALERYFGVTKLSAAITQAYVEPKRADVKKWRAEIDRKIFFD